jgi:hypothetical protein
MKKNIYIVSFIFFGIVLQFLIHGIVERWYISLLVNDFQMYAMGLTWQQWFMVHHIGTGILIIAGFFFGLWQGKYWWKRIYEKSKV